MTRITMQAAPPAGTTAPSQPTSHGVSPLRDGERPGGTIVDAPDEQSELPGHARARSIYVVGGEQHSLRPLHAGTQSWYRYRKGVILHVDVASEQVTPVFEYESPADVCPPENPAILFKSGTLVCDTIYLCTQTEVMVCRLPDFERLHYVSLPHFHDVHHVRPTPAGTLLVANTGLDMVLEITLEGDVVKEWSVIDEPAWSRFSRTADYRTVASTKPHLAHPNHVFYIGEEVWVTRFEQRDALCLSDPRRRIQIGLERMHDGIAHGDFIYFSTVDGKIAIVGRSTLRVEEILDLNDMSEDGCLLGWCRGLFVEDGMMWVGFSRLRPTKFRENVSWVSKGFRRELPSRVSRYDLTKRRCEASIDTERFGLNAVFSVLPHAVARAPAARQVPAAAFAV